MTPYQRKLQDPRWKRRRLEKLDQAGWACDNCGEESLPLHVHHARYMWGREPWEYGDDELQTVCEVCHSTWTSAGKKWKEVTASNHPHFVELSGLVGGFLGEEDLSQAGDQVAVLAGKMIRKMLEGWKVDDLIQLAKHYGVEVPNA